MTTPDGIASFSWDDLTDPAADVELSLTIDSDCGRGCIRCDEAWRSAPGRTPSQRICAPFIVCPTCGNKRCPKATDHRLDCTGSNEVGQKGSVWQNVT